MTLVIAHVSIEGSTAADPGYVFDADEKVLKHLRAAGAVSDASDEDIALAKARGRFIEPAAAPAAEPAPEPKAEGKKAAAPKAADPKPAATDSEL